METTAQTKVNREKLEKYCQKFPGCRRFLENFFGTCSGISFEANHANYVMDLGLYSPTNQHIRKNRTSLEIAFHEIASRA